jgi:hypothetical protein
MLISMYWRGCRHPASRCCRPLHPSTALERWISRFSLVYQVDHGREILDLFAAEEARVHDLACQIIARTMPRMTSSPCAVPVLSKLSRAIETETALKSCGPATLA